MVVRMVRSLYFKTVVIKNFVNLCWYTHHIRKLVDLKEFIPKIIEAYHRYKNRFSA